MEIIFGILLLVALAYVATSATFLKLRRATVVGVLVSGGWLGVLAGLAIGPGGIGILSPELVINASPLLTVGLGWIGLMIGLQLRRDILKQLPSAMIRLSLIDALASIAIFGFAAALLLPYWFQHDSAIAMIAPVALLAAGAIGWTAETRSLRLADAQNSAETLTLRGAASLSTPVAVLVFSFGLAMVRGRDIESLTFSATAPVLRFVALILIAIVLGIISRFGLRRAQGNRSELLAIFLGVVAIITGAANELEMSPLLSAMLAGIVIANLAGKELRKFERFIIEAEHAVATLYWIVAGVLLDIRLGPLALVIAAAIILLRVVCKPTIVAMSRVSNSSEFSAKQLLHLTPIRQSPMAIMLGVALVIAIPSDLNHRLLAIVALTGITCDVIAVAARGLRKRPTAAEQPAAPTEEPAA